MASTIWLTDRSRREAALDHCARDRFLNYHFGPFGYGIARKAQSIPLVAGIHYHDGLALVLDHLLTTDTLPPDAVVREACAMATAAYRNLVQARGLAQLDAGERLDTVVAEQCCLIEGLIWAVVLTTLPEIHRQARVIAVEHEELYLLGCSCGLGEGIGELADHEARDCQGIGYQSRPDFVVEYRARPGVLAYFEFKGAGQAGFAEDWEYKVQFTTGALGFQARTGLLLSEGWVVQLVKGRREASEWDPATKTRSGPLVQNTTLCYWYRREGNPPLDPPDWQEQYEYQDAEGKNRRLGPSYRKAGLWTIAEDMPELRQAGISIPEFAAKFIARERLGKHVALVGPLQINQVMLSELAAEVLADEERWMAIVWELHSVLTTEAGGDWTHPSYQAALQRLVPRNFSGCRRYGKRYGCQFIDLCHYHEGWGDPLGSGSYVHRLPHHEPERQQQIARGIVVEPGMAEEEE